MVAIASALARGLARQLGGDLKLMTAAPGGGCFALTMPIRP